MKGKVAIITGGNTGIGFATSRLLASQGAQVLIASLDPERGAEAEATIRDEGGTALFVETDVTQAAEVSHMVKTTLRKFGRIDVLFCNAGFSSPADVVHCHEDDWNHTLAVHLTGAFLCSKYVVPEMIRLGGGSILINSSQQALVGSKNSAAYSAAKGGLIALARAMAIDYAEHNIRVNCICPGAVKTEAMLRWLDQEGAPDREAWLMKHPLGRFGLPEEIAKAVLYLVSDDATWITGSTLVIDGGFTAQ